MDLTHVMEDDLMPAPIPVPVRQTILQRWRQGDSVVLLAAELHLSQRTVRHLVRRFARRGKEGLTMPAAPPRRFRLKASRFERQSRCDRSIRAGAAA